MASTYVTKDGVDFQKNVHAAVIEQLGQHKPLDGRLGVSFLFHQPSAQACDISNYLKSTEDALTKAGVWIDDSQIDRELLVRGAIDRTNPRVEIVIKVIRQPERTLF